MNRTFLACGAATLLLTSNAPSAQQTFTAQQFARLVGTWDLDTKGDPSHAAERRVMTVSPEALHVEIQRAEDARPPRLTYRFDGQDSVVDFGRGKATGRLIRDAAAMVTETVYEINNSPITVRDVFTLNAGGTQMVVKATFRVEHGYEGPLPAGASKPNVSSAVMLFVKQP